MFLNRKPHRLYFLHIPKTAGTSVTTWLTGKIGKSRTCPAKNWDQLVCVPDNELSRYTLFCGHYGWGLDSFLKRPVETITILRDPVERTWSHYRHVVRDNEHPRHVAVARQSFEAFLNDRQNWPMIENFQARYLVKAPIIFRDYSRHLDSAVVKLNRLSVASEEARYLLEPSYVREKALENLSLLKVVGVTEQLPRFFSDVMKATSLGCEADDAMIPFENMAPVSPNSARLDQSMLQIIRDLTQIDQEIYERVFTRRSE